MSTKLSSGSTGFPMSRTVPSISGRQSLVLISLFLLSNIIFRYFFFLSKRSTSTNRRNPTELVFLSLSLSSRSFHRLLFSSFSRPLPLPSSSSSSLFGAADNVTSCSGFVPLPPPFPVRMGEFRDMFFNDRFLLYMTRSTFFKALPSRTRQRSLAEGGCVIAVTSISDQVALSTTKSNDGGRMNGSSFSFF